MIWYEINKHGRETVSACITSLALQLTLYILYCFVLLSMLADQTK